MAWCVEHSQRWRFDHDELAAGAERALARVRCGLLLHRRPRNPVPQRLLQPQRECLERKRVQNMPTPCHHARRELHERGELYLFSRLL